MDLKAKVNDVKAKVKAGLGRKKNDLEIWWSRNKEWAIVALPIAAGAAGTGIKYILRASNIHREEKMKYRSMWDGRQHWDLKKKPSNKQRLDIDRRLRAGERMGDILESMKLI